MGHIFHPSNNIHYDKSLMESYKKYLENVKEKIRYKNIFNFLPYVLIPLVTG